MNVAAKTISVRPEAMVLSLIAVCLPALLLGVSKLSAGSKYVREQSHAVESTAVDSRPLKLTPHRVVLGRNKRFNLYLPAGFEITVAAQGLKRVRFMAKSPDDRIFAADLYNRTDNQKGAVIV